ncbi:MAG: hypothetical protein K0R60_45 [Microbacterium sp.]|jgi:hypothetical protein|nr:hypothetical protein [Microbacterium sp.]
MSARDEARAALAAIEDNSSYGDGGIDSRVLDQIADALRALLDEPVPAHPLDALWDGTPSTARAIANAKARERLDEPVPADEREAPDNGDLDVNDDGSILGIPPRVDQWTRHASVSPRIVAEVDAKPGPESDAIVAYAIINSHYFASDVIPKTHCAFCGEAVEDSMPEHRARMLVAAGFRRQGTITDAMVDAAARAMYARANALSVSGARDLFRAGLEAAEAAR